MSRPSLQERVYDLLALHGGSMLVREVEVALHGWAVSDAARKMQAKGVLVRGEKWDRDARWTLIPGAARPIDRRGGDQKSQTRARRGRMSRRKGLQERMYDLIMLHGGSMPIRDVEAALHGWSVYSAAKRMQTKGVLITEKEGGERMRWTLVQGAKPPVDMRGGNQRSQCNILLANRPQLDDEGNPEIERPTGPVVHTVSDPTALWEVWARAPFVSRRHEEMPANE